MELNELFNNFLNEIKQLVSDNVYTLWFSPLEPISLDGNNLTIKVPMDITRKILSTTHKNIIDEALTQLTGKVFNITYLIEEEIEANNKPKKAEMISQEEIENLSDEWDSNLNPKFTFDTFVVGESNKFAVSSAHSVAENPGTLHNPFFIYGKSGIGKTHLMQAIGNYIKEHTNMKVLYVGAEKFKEEYVGISSVVNGYESSNSFKEFKNKYQNVDVLIIDDIQLLVTATKSQNEFFNTFNALYQKNKQIIISSDKSPDDLDKLEDRLKSRFMWGLPVNIYPPDFNLKCDIIKSKAKNTILEEKFNDKIVEYIANICQKDVRQIEGSVNRLLAYTSMMKPEKIDLEFTMEALNDYSSSNIYTAGEKSIAEIQKIVADYFNITIADLKSKKRTNEVAKPRQIAMYLCRVETNEGLQRIGLEFGARDHSTVSAAFDKITKDEKNDIKLSNIIKELKNKL